ncbi:Proline-rich receptor-like protein kinase PERK1 [Madurella mycetomatis]|uniref:Proline-rich receptor-like protein kinase PERK1 n=1 Tax=Madurella mycetomatis TaxID=100816 RepID=A0A175VYI4_9PEZI|nr:Proline-rich receptor-like protein kinase PERK1 [Madurella mycetomatis]
MHRSSLFVAPSALAAPATLQKLGNDKPWTPAAETSTIDHPNHLAWSHKPTDAPRPRYGETELLRRDFSMGTDTCGFFSGYSSIPVTCVKQSAYCTHDGAGNMDCCTGDYSSCTETMFSACLDFSASQKGACAGRGPRTICCWPESPSCYTLLFSTTATPDRVFSIFQCQTMGGLATILATPPNYPVTSPTTSSQNAPSTTLTDPSEGAGSFTPVGAIVGGVVGGVAVLGLVTFLIILYVIRSRRRNDTAQPVQYTNVTQNAQGPLAGNHPQPQYLQSQPLIDKPYGMSQPPLPYQLVPAPQPGYNIVPQNQTYPHQYPQTGPNPYHPPRVDELPINPALGTQSRRAELD